MTPAETLTARLGGRWCAGGRYGSCRCPAHDDCNPSLTVRDGSSAPLVKCHSGCNGQAIVEELRRRGWWPIEQLERSADRPKRTAADTQRYIMEVWRHSRPIEGTLVETYLRARGITVAVPPSFRFHPSLKHTDTQLSFPTMVAAVQANHLDCLIAILRAIALGKPL